MGSVEDEGAVGEAILEVVEEVAISKGRKKKIDVSLRKALIP
jgi:hypothetical protein